MSQCTVKMFPSQQSLQKQTYPRFLRSGKIPLNT